MKPSTKASPRLSIVIPAKNEAAALNRLLPTLTGLYPEAQIVVVNDGSTDDTKDVCEQHSVECITHPYSKGNGAAIKTGARAAKGDLIVFMDGDGQHRPEDIERLLAKIEQGNDMVVGARSRHSQASVGRLAANTLYNKVASLMVGQNIQDLTSGFRAVKRRLFIRYLDLLPNGFSYPTTITMAFFRAGYSVSYEPIVADKRVGKSHINLVKDGVRFLLIIFKIGTLYSPLKLFLPLSFLFFLLGSLRYIQTYLDAQQFTNMSALLYSVAVVVFLIGLVSEQITTLIYQRSNSEPDD